jgi:hypothetical protein
MFAASACLNPKQRKTNTPYPTSSEMQNIFLRASQSLMQTTTITQMALDLVTMASIAQRYSPSEISQRSATPLCALHQMFVRKLTWASLPTLACFLASFAEACRPWGQRRAILEFLSRSCRTPAPLSSRDWILVSYFGYRMDGIPHYDSLERLSVTVARAGDFVNLIQ